MSAENPDDHQPCPIPADPSEMPSRQVVPLNARTNDVGAHRMFTVWLEHYVRHVGH